MTDVLYWLAVVAILLFPVLYTILARWWETPHGRYNMALSVGLVALAGPSLARRIFGDDYPGHEHATEIALAIVAVVVWWRIWLLLRVQFIERRKVRRRNALPRD